MSVQALAWILERIFVYNDFIAIFPFENLFSVLCDYELWVFLHGALVVENDEHKCLEIINKAVVKHSEASCRLDFAISLTHRR